MRSFTNKSIKMTPSLQSELMCVDIISNYTEGKFRMIVKTKLGMTCVDARDFDNPRIMANPECAINGMFYNTNLMDMSQYKLVGSSSWASMAFVENKVEVAA